MASDKQMNIGGSGTGQSTVSVNIVNDLKVNSKSVPVFEETNVTGSEVLTIQNADTLAGKSLTELLLMIYPVGSIYMSASSTNPGMLFGGTWVAWGQGRVPVGVNADDSAYSGSDKTGGSATVTPSGSVADATQGGTISDTTAGGTVGGHTLTKAELPAIDASFTAVSGYHYFEWNHGPDGYQTDLSPGYFEAGGNNNYSTYARTVGIRFGGNGSHNHGFTGTAHNHTFTGSAHSHTFTGTAQSTIQPYVTCYMWKRTA